MTDPTAPAPSSTPAGEEGRRPTAAARAPEPEHPPVRTVLVRLLVVLLLVVVDQWTKAETIGWLEGGMGSVEELERDQHGHQRVPLGRLFGDERELPLVGDRLGLMVSYNKGAAFGRFGDYPHVLVGGRILAVAVLGWLLVRARRGDRLGLTALVLVLSGAAGNLVDNLWTGLRQEGHPYGLVRDFIDVWFRSERFGWDWHFHTFNVADACISVGAVLWILAGLLHREPREEPVDDGDTEELDALPGSAHARD